MLAVTLPLLGLAVAKGAHRLYAARTVLLAKGYTKAFNDDPAKVADHAKAYEHDADYHETMYRTFRARGRGDARLPGGADKNGGKFGLHALSWANEAERSADVVTTSYLNDELRAQGETIVCNIKNRENPLFDPVRLSIDWGSRRI